MELVTITAGGQITLPARIKRRLNLRNGDKAAFVEQNGQFMIVNPEIFSLAKIQLANDVIRKQQDEEAEQRRDERLKEMEAVIERRKNALNQNNPDHLT